MRATGDQFDVAVVGASLAGSSAALLFARRGLRVALLERSPDAMSYKRACTHYIQAGAAQTIARLGLESRIEGAGGLRNGIDIWTRYGWIRPSERMRRGARRGFNVSRRTLDPMLRAMAAGTPGVELMLGHRACGLFGADGGLGGVEADTPEGAHRAVRARLVVGADGRDSQIARLAGLRARVRPNARFAYFAYYEGLSMPRGRSLMWLLDPDVAYAFPNDGGLTVLACFPTRARLPDFRRDLEGSFASTLARLPDAPRLEHARRVSPIIGRVDLTNRAHPPAAPGLALIGDAALASDPVWGVGCGWAIQTAEMLVEEAADELLAGCAPARGLRRYRLRHLAGPGVQHAFLCDFSTGRRFSALERLFFAAAARDGTTAAHVEAYGERRISPWRFAHPLALARAAARGGVAAALARESARARSSQ